jgi:hypothetical protein
LIKSQKPITQSWVVGVKAASQISSFSQLDEGSAIANTAKIIFFFIKFFIGDQWSVLEYSV